MFDTSAMDNGTNKAAFDKINEALQALNDLKAMADENATSPDENIWQRPKAQEHLTNALAHMSFFGKSLLNEIDQQAADKLKAAERAEDAQLPQAWPLGSSVEGEGIFIGARYLRDENRSIIGAFNFFAAPEDLTERDGSDSRLRKDFYAASKRLETMAPWHGHKGKSFSNEQNMLKEFSTGDYKGEWFLPSLELAQDNLVHLKSDYEGRNLFKWDRWTYEFMTCTEKTAEKFYLFNLKTEEPVLATKKIYSYDEPGSHGIPGDVYTTTENIHIARPVRAVPLKIK